MGTAPHARHGRAARRSLAVIALSALPVLAGAATPVKYSDLRQEYASIDAAIALMPSSDLTASFNHLSMLLSRRDVESMPAGSGAVGELPGNFETQMTSALAGLRDDLERGLWALGPEEQWVVLQLVSGYAFERNVELYSGVVHEPCASPSADTPCFSLPVYRELSELVAVLRPTLNEVAAWYETIRGPLPPYDGLGGTGARPTNFPERVAELSRFLTATGIESIDY